MNIEQLRALDAATAGNDYPDDVLERLLPHVEEYFRLAGELRRLPLAEVPNALVMTAGGRK